MADKSFEKLESWRDAMDFVEEIYRLTNGFPQDEKAGMTAALRRGAAVIPAKIADGYGRNDNSEYSKALAASMGALREIHTHLALARRLKYISWWRSKGIRKSTERMMAMLNNEIKRLNQPDSESQKKAPRASHSLRGQAGHAGRSTDNQDREARPMEIEIVTRGAHPGFSSRIRRLLLPGALRRP